MYLRQPCPQCGHDAEYVYVQVGHTHCCKKCNCEFDLKPKGVNYGKYVIAVLVLVVIVAFVAFILKTFHDWWIYQKV
jgi:hypothetical protein